MFKKNIYFGLLSLTLIISGCAAPTPTSTEIRTNPPGANVTIDGLKEPEVTPFPYQFDFSKKNDYTLRITKDGFFEQEYIVKKSNPSLDKGAVTIDLSPSPLWEATRTSPATNNWVQILVGSNLDTKQAWQIMIDAVVKRSSNVKELNYESGYLQTKYTVKKFDTKNGEFLLRCQLIATLLSSEPLIYRIKDVAEWSGNGVQWHPYNRIFAEHADMITEIEDRLKSN
ncbi:MAG: hypothetical protein V2B20_24245 [Pseudomonadota bacterium]